MWNSPVQLEWTAQLALKGTIASCPFESLSAQVVPLVNTSKVASPGLSVNK